MLDRDCSFCGLEWATPDDFGMKWCVSGCRATQKNFPSFLRDCPHLAKNVPDSNCDAAKNCFKDGAKAGEDANKRSTDLAQTSGEIAEQGKTGRTQQLDNADRRLQELSSQIESGRSNTPVSSLQNDAQVLQSARNAIQNGEPLPKGIEDQAIDPIIRRDLTATRFFDETNRGFEEAKNYYQTQAQKYGQWAEQSKKRMQGLETPDEFTDGLPGGGASARKVTEPNEKRPEKLALEQAKGESSDSLEFIEAKDRIEKALGNISSKSLRDALRKRLLAKLKGNPSEKALADAEREIAEIAAKENLPTGAQAATEELLAAAGKGEGRSISSLDLEDGARNLREELQRADDEKAGITYSDGRTLFERIKTFLQSCWKNQCVR